MAVQLPGRESRYRERRETDFVSVVERLARMINDQVNEELAIFGHSLGGMLGFAVCQELQRKHGRYVEAFFVSGRRPPGYDPVKLEDIQTDAALISFLKRMGGLPTPICSHREVLDVYLPIVRDDLMLNHNSKHFEFTPIDSPIITFSGERDALASPADMAAWHAFSTQAGSSHIYGGGHFFINDFAAPIHAVMRDTLELGVSV